MPKPAAFLFYPNDWLADTVALSRYHKGCYIDLLVAQFAQGPLALETIKTVLAQNYGAWTVLQAMFTQNAQGLFFNEKLAAEIAKRKAYCQSRKQNAQARYEPKAAKHKLGAYAKHIQLHTKNKNENGNENGIFGPDLVAWKPVFEKWIDYRKSIKKPLPPKSMQAAFGRLFKLSNGSLAEAESMVNFCMANGYQGLFADRPKGNNPSINAPKTLTQQWME